VRIISVAALRRIGILLAVLLLLAALFWFFYLRMPGRSHEGPVPDPEDGGVRELADALRRDVEALGGERNVYTPQRYAAAARFLEDALRDAGYATARQEYEAVRTTCCNIEAEITGSDEIVVIGAHYDSFLGCPGANDNGSGVAGLLALARRFARRETARTLRFVFFANEEPPFFQTGQMGSLVYARRCEERGEKVVGMLALETIGCFSDEEGSQRYPIPPLRWIYGTTGNFIGFVGNVSSGGLLRDCLRVFRRHARIPSEGASMPGVVPGIGWSDHWAFWQAGYYALMVTDTAPFRYEHYHRETDTPDRLDYDRMALVIEGLVPVVEALANPE
jgi:hypothetical protein